MVSLDDPDYDIYRDSLLRYCGYANEVGEAFRAQEMSLKINSKPSNAGKSVLATFLNQLTCHNF